MRLGLLFVLLLFLLPLSIYAQNTDTGGYTGPGGNDNPEPVEAVIGEEFEVMVMPGGSLVNMTGHRTELVLVIMFTEQCPDRSCINIIMHEEPSLPVTLILHPGDVEETPNLMFSLLELTENTARLRVDAIDCVPEWICGNWTGCENGLQWRECRDLKACNNDATIPSMFQECYEPPDDTFNQTTDNDTGDNVTDINIPPDDTGDQPDTVPDIECTVVSHCNEFGGCTRGIRVRRCWNLYTCNNTIVNEWLDKEDCIEEEYVPPEDTTEVITTVTNIRSGEDSVINTTNKSVSVRTITVNVKNEVPVAEVRIKRLAEKPPEVKEKITRNRVYEYLEINNTGIEDNNIENASISFHVSKLWLAMNNIDMETITLYRYHDDEWAGMPTQMVSDDIENVYYEAQTPGFSIFAIAGDYIVQFSGGICIPMDRRCENLTIEECSFDGNEWVFVEECSYLCVNGECVSKPEAGLVIHQTNLFIALVIIIAVLLVLVVYTKIKKKKAMQDLKDVSG